MSAALSLPRDPPDDGEEAPSRIGMAAFILSLREKGVSDLAILRAMELVPRELFAPRRYRDLARQDVALPLACGQTMTSPGAVAAMLAALDVQPGQLVLEIGTGSGYVSALLAAMGGLVLSVERRAILAEGACSRLRLAGFGETVRIVCADGLADMGEDGAVASFDRILVNGWLPAVPIPLVGLVPAGGRLVFGLASGAAGASPTLTVLARDAEGALLQGSLGPVRLGPLLPAHAR